MKCNTIERMLTGYMNGTLGSAQTWEVRMHLSHCAGCSRVLRDFENTGRILRDLPIPLIRPDFDERLFARVASMQTQKTRIPRWLGLTQWTLRGQLQTAFAVTALLLVVGVPTLFRPTALPYQSQGGAVSAADAGLVQRCLEQQSTIVATQPLADWSAQNLAGHLDNVSLPATPSADDTDESL